jgi:hypothetical protein
MPASDIDLAPQPKVFISYSWSTPKHQQQVMQWAERLIADAVDVVLDVFDLKEGHDKYHFMERMVVDPGITHVLVVSDQQYTDKADRRASGVGTESQIISSEIYGKVSQSKFVPIVCEFSAGGDPYLPVFMQSLIWIDFSSAEAVNQNWERLVRLLHGKPAYKKPQLGSLPAYLAESPASPASPLVGKLATLRQALISSSRIAGGARQDFLAACLNFAEPYRIKQDLQLDQKSLTERLLRDSEELKVLRDGIVDWTLLESSFGSNHEFSEPLLLFLEQLLEVGSRPPNVSRWSEAWFEAIKVFIYETFIYIVAALLKNRAYGLLNDVLSSSYIVPRSNRYGNNEFGRIEQFFHSSDFFQVALAPANTRLYSPTAELIKRHADRIDLALDRLIEADLVIFLKAITSRQFRWHPQTIFYANNSEFPFLIRAAQRRNFKHLATVIGISDSGTLKNQAKQGYEESGIPHMSDFHMSMRTPWESLRIDAYDTV